MELRGNNLYRNGKIIELSDNERLLTRDKINVTSSSKDIYYTVKQEDRLDLIAYKHYHNKVEDSSKYWWVIADVNNIIDPMDLQDLVGKDILIPDIISVLLEIK